MNILLTGGAGYIGTHTAVALLDAGHSIVIADNLSNSNKESIKRVEIISGKPVFFHEIDIRDELALDAMFTKYPIDGVIHFAGQKAVGESIKKPLEYYDNNINSTLSLLRVMRKHNVSRLVFSSSATVYGNAQIPYSEIHITGQGLTSPYAQTKYMVEQIMRDEATAKPSSQFVALRYFNPVGAHESGLIGEDPNDTPNNLMPFVSQVASGERDKLVIFGNDYNTIDGTCVRDFIHVMDLAKGHVASLENLENGFDAINLGSGSGTSVLQIVHAFEKACGRKIPYGIGPRRPGDLAEFYADVTKSKYKLHWQTKKTVDDACSDSWNWQLNNPHGYRA